MANTPKVRIRAEGDVPDSPSATVAKAAERTASVTDSMGRAIVVRKISALQLYRLTKIMGALASNETTLNLAMTAASIASIDGTAVHFPANEAEIEFTIQRLDFDGMSAASEGLRSFVEDEKEIVEASKN